MARTEDKAWSRFRVLVTIFLVVAGLYLTQEVLLPFALAGLLSFLLSPLVTRLERVRLGHVASVLVVGLFACLVLFGLGWTVTDQVIELAGELPKYESTLLTKARAVRETFNGQGGLTRTLEEVQRELVKKDPEPPPADKGPPLGVTSDHPLPIRDVDRPLDPLPLRVIRDLVRPLLTPVGTAVIVIVLTIFMLLQRHDLRDRLIRLAGTGQLYVTTQALDEAARKVSRFLQMQLLINTLFGVGAATGLFFIGLPNALLWGLLATTFRFIPYVGPWIAAAFPVLLSVAIFDTWTPPLLALGLFVVLEVVCANVLEPWLYGSHTGISPVGIFAAAAFWTWLWGPIGLVVSMPLTVVVVVLGRYVPPLTFVNVLLSAQPALELGTRFYQRLLAFDDHEAAELVQTFLQTGGVDELYDTMVLPALSMSERDRIEDHLSERQLRFIHRAIRRLIG
jgi:predicted PurR-regulated permease PerM